MKGQRLFVRPVMREDLPKLTAFYALEGVAPGDSELDRSGLLGFLVGEVAAHLTFRSNPEEIEIVHIWTARELRGKRVARVMISELSDLARKLGASRLAVRKSPDTGEVFRHLGFLEERADRLVLPLE